MANRIVKITDEYGDYIYPLCGEGLVMPAFTTKGTITTGTPSGGTLTWMHLRYGFTSDKNEQLSNMLSKVSLFDTSQFFKALIFDKDEHS